MIKEDDIIIIGKFHKTHALKGELNMISDIDPDFFLEGNPVIVEYDGILVPYYIETLRPKGSTSYLVKLDGINSEEEAGKFVNKEIGVLKKEAEDWLGEEIIESSDIIGFKIVDIDEKKDIGTIVDIEDTTQNHLFILKNHEGEEIFIPANEDLIKEINEEEKLIYMNIPEGLVDINKKNDNIK